MNAQVLFDARDGDAAQRERAAELLYAQGMQLHEEDRFADAAAVFRLLIRLAPTDERGWLALGDCHHRAGQSEMALELWGAGVVAAEPAPLCALARFRTLWDLDRHPHSDEAYEEAVHQVDLAGDPRLEERLGQERQARP